jgi:hypothetical protein
MSDRPSAFLQLLLLVAAFGSAVASAQTYVAFEPAESNSQRYPGEPVVPSLITQDGAKTIAPQVDEQVGFKSVQISSDHKRVGWVARTTDAAFPSKLIIFKGNKIERVIDELCIDKWAFRHGGSQVIYAAEACHYFSGISITLVDVASGRQLAGFVVERDVETDEPLNLKQLPRWVGGFFPFAH